MLFSEQLAELDVKSSSNVTDGEAIVRPLAASLHVTDHCKTRWTVNGSATEIQLYFFFVMAKSNVLFPHEKQLVS